MKVAAIVPAYNEEKTISGVLAPLLGSPRIDEVVVVNDGSEDRTTQVAQAMGARVLELPQNIGKGGAMKAGVGATDAQVLLYVDADLLGLTEEHIASLLTPVLRGEADMTVGVFDEGRLATDLAQRLTPFLSGQRAMRREVMEQIPDVERSGYGVEVALSRYAERNGIRVVHVPLRNLAQVMKEEKHGLARGLYRRLKMYWEIITWWQ